VTRRSRWRRGRNVRGKESENWGQRWEKIIHQAQSSRGYKDEKRSGEIQQVNPNECQREKREYGEAAGGVLLLILRYTLGGEKRQKEGPRKSTTGGSNAKVGKEWGEETTLQIVSEGRILWRRLQGKLDNKQKRGIDMRDEERRPPSPKRKEVKGAGTAARPPRLRRTRLKMNDFIIASTEKPNPARKKEKEGLTHYRKKMNAA